MKEHTTNNGWAIVTGASRGIGLELARGLAAMGYRLVIVARSEEGLLLAREELLRSQAKEVVTIALNLAERDAPHLLYKECVARGIDVEVLVNNAGVFAYCDLCDMTKERVDAILSLHIAATTELCHLFARDMRARGRGYILNISSYAAWLPLGGLGMYSATKSYVRDFSYALREELAEEGVVVTVALPAGVATDLYGLPKRYQHLGLRCGALLTPERVAREALDGLFKGRRRVVPGVVNRLLLPVVRHLPRSIKKWLRKKTLGFQK